MSSRSIVLSLHLIAVAAWLGADLLQHAVTPRISRHSHEFAAVWLRQQVWLHQRYYSVAGGVILLTGVLLVLDGGWSWSSGFIWVGFAAITGGIVLGRGVLGSVARQRLAALDAGELKSADQLARRTLPLALLVTGLPVVAIVAMVEKWGL